MADITFQKWNGTEWIDQDLGGGSVGTSNHASLTNLAWDRSRHSPGTTEETASASGMKYAGFDVAGNPHVVDHDDMITPHLQTSLEY